MLGPVATAVVAWALNRHEKLKWEKRLRKEERYKALLRLLTGFYVPRDTQDAKYRTDQKTLFLQEWRLAWLDCPDEVIRRGDHFLSLVQTGKKCPDEVKEHAVASFVAAMREDIFGKSDLAPEDYRHWAST